MKGGGAKVVAGRVDLPQMGADCCAGARTRGLHHEWIYLLVNTLLCAIIRVDSWLSGAYIWAGAMIGLFYHEWTRMNTNVFQVYINHVLHEWGDAHWIR